MKSALYTFGYEGMTIEAFISRLKAQGVKTVIDVRELPLSRKKGFSKTAFADALHVAGIAYAHMPALGCPRSVRNAYRVNGDWSLYTKGFLEHLAKQREAVSELAKLAAATSACLVCFEADYNYCHRSLVARAAAQAGGPPITHLTARTAIAELLAKAAA